MMNRFLPLIFAGILTSSCGNDADHNANVERMIREADSTGKADSIQRTIDIIQLSELDSAVIMEE